MTNEERQIITDFVARMGGATAQSSQWGSTSVPATAAPALPPIDREADAFIADQFTQHPEARYRITQLAFVQEHALIEAQSRIKRLEWELQQTQQAAQQASQQTGQQRQGGGGFLSGLFGGGRAQPPPGQAGPGGPWGQGGGPPPGYQQQYGAPPPQYPPNYNPGMFQRQGSGFLGSALTTAAGVAGGVLAADAIRDMFSPHQGMGIGGGSTPGIGSPWGAPTPDPGYVDQGAWSTPPDPGAGTPDQGYADQGTWDQPDPSQGGDAGSWSDPGNVDPSSDPGAGGLDDQSGGSDDSLT